MNPCLRAAAIVSGGLFLGSDAPPPVPAVRSAPNVETFSFEQLDEKLTLGPDGSVTMDDFGKEFWRRLSGDGPSLSTDDLKVVAVKQLALLQKHRTLVQCRPTWPNRRPPEVLLADLSVFATPTSVRCVLRDSKNNLIGRTRAFSGALGMHPDSPTREPLSRMPIPVGAIKEGHIECTVAVEYLLKRPAGEFVDTKWEEMARTPVRAPIKIVDDVKAPVVVECDQAARKTIETSLTMGARLEKDSLSLVLSVDDAGGALAGVAIGVSGSVVAPQGMVGTFTTYLWPAKRSRRMRRGEVELWLSPEQSRTLQAVPNGGWKVIIAGDADEAYFDVRFSTVFTGRCERELKIR